MEKSMASSSSSSSNHDNSSSSSSSSSSNDDNSAAVASYEASMSYIRLVQNLIERCLMLCMDQGECVHALAIYAAIPTAVTTTVWKELEKTNPEFFHSYFTYKGEYHHA